MDEKWTLDRKKEEKTRRKVRGYACVCPLLQLQITRKLQIQTYALS